MALLSHSGPLAAGFTAIALATQLSAQTIPFTADRWDLANARVVEHLGRQALTGFARLRDATIGNGVIEVDVAMRSGVRSYPGFHFRIQSEGEAERFYLRPHRSPLYADAVQYAAAFHGMDSWQLYNGPGYSAAAVIPTDRWIHLRVEVAGTQARIFLDSAASPALTVWELEHGASAGGIALNTGPSEGPPAAFFSNFSWRPGDSLAFGPAPTAYAAPGFLRDWEVSQPTAQSLVDADRYPDASALNLLPWTRASATPRGLLDISRLTGRSRPEPEVVLARTTVRATRDEVRKFWLGYSDEITVFVNGRPVYSGSSAYRSRDLSFLGIVGLFDAVYAPLRRGDNEVLVALAEASGGWGVTLRDATAVLEAPGLRRAWASAPVLHIPESAVFDPARNAIYVSNYDGYHPSGGAGRQHIAKFSADGRLESPEWIAGLNNPTGLAVSGDRLYAVEPRQLVVIDIPTAQILQRYPAQTAAALNDVAIAENGDVYVSDSRGSAIFRLADGRFEEWLRSPDVIQPNGVLVGDGQLIVVTNGDRALKTIDLTTKALRVIATLHRGFLDGVDADGAGNYLVSYNEGMLLRVTPQGDVTTLLDLTSPGTNIADFDYVPERNLLVFPTFLDNRVIAYRMDRR
jgi:sugar lactone lactonase YvrE